MLFLINWMYRTFAEFVENVSDSIEWFFRLGWSVQLMARSFGVMYAISDLWAWFFQLIDGSFTRPLWQSILLLPVLVPYWLCCAGYAILSYPFSISHIERAQIRNLVWGIPSILAMLLTASVFVHAMMSLSSVHERYRSAMKLAFVSGNYELATVIGGRLMSDPDLADPEMTLSYAIALQKTGETHRFQVILASLAPSESPGYAPAHRMRAMALAEQLRRGSSKSVLAQLRWHLENSGSDPNAEIEALWSAYFVTIGQIDDAIQHLERASRLDHRHLIALADLHVQSENATAAGRALRSAEGFFDQRLKENPLSCEDRIQLALVRVRLGKIASAEETVLKGVALLDTAEMRRGAAYFFLVRYDMVLKQNPQDVQLQFSCLEKALEQDVSYGPIYERLVLFFENADSRNYRESIEELLHSILASGKSPALAHFALSGVYLTVGDADNAKFHLDQSYSLNPGLSLVTNNLAWVIAHSDRPDLNKASDLVEKALLANPTNIQFRDTRATILMKLGKTRDAITEFEAILGESANKLSIHRKLAELYQQLDRHALARVHLEKANALVGKLTTVRN